MENKTTNAPRMGEVAHTPTPWHSKHSTAGGHDLHALYDANGVAFGHFTSYAERTNEERWLGKGKPLEQAAFIVRAVNSHAALVAALEAVLQVACENGAEESRYPSDRAAVDQARAALQSAKGNA